MINTEWNFVAAVLDDDNDEVTFYINEEKETVSYIEEYEGGIPTSFNIGATNIGSYTNYLNGSIKEYRIYDRKLTPLEIEEIYLYTK